MVRCFGWQAVFLGCATGYSDARSTIIDRD